MRNRLSIRSVLLALFVLAVSTASGSGGQWSRQPGERVRDSFGPTGGACRGACGMGCPTSSCALTVGYECAGGDRLRRVRTYVCGTHQGCRAHDDCLDRCRQQRAKGLDCEALCHTEAVEQYGVETATSWGMGGGPFDDRRITFEYTRDAPDAPEPLFRCPAGAQLGCGSPAGRCVTADGTEAAPVFDAYAAGAGASGMHVSGFESGRLCGGGAEAAVCEQTVDIDVTGDRTWYGFEFDYSGADPSAPLRCLATGAEDDFMGGVIKSMVALAPADDNTEAGKVLGRIQRELGRGASLTDILSGIRVTPAGKSPPAPPAPGTSPGVPASVPIPAASGHLVVPMFELRDGAPPGSTLVRDVRCTHNGAPVLETSFRLRFPKR
jgi:hypothetical protein